MKYFGKMTYLTEGASQEQMLLEKEYHDLLKKSNTMAIISLIFMFTIIGFPIGLLILIFSRPFKTQKRLKILEKQIIEVQIKNARKE